MSDIIESNVPMWGIGGDKELDQQAAIIADLRLKLSKTDSILNQLEEQLETLSKRANMYVKSTIKMNDYDSVEHMLYIDDNLKAVVYPMKLYKTISSIDELPPKKEEEKVQLTSKQADKIISLMHEYNEVVEEYDEYNESYEDLILYHDEIWDDVIDSLTNFSGFHVYDCEEDEELEEFDPEIHTLLVIKDEDLKWGFRYIRKEDEEEFNKLIEEEFDKSSEEEN